VQNLKRKPSLLCICVHVWQLLPWELCGFIWEIAKAQTSRGQRHDINPLFLDACLTEHRPPPGHSIWQMGGIMHIM